MRSVLSIFLVSFCSFSNAQSKHLVYNNLVILSDLSNRVENEKYPNKDLNEIHKITQFFKNECVMPGVKIGDKSVLSFSTFSAKPAIVFDIDNLFGDDLSKKQSFVNSTGVFKNAGFIKGLIDFEAKIKLIYKNVKNPGLDLISLLIEKIENGNILRETVSKSNGKVVVTNEYINHLFVFTDGYLEFSKNSNSQFYFSSKQIASIRKFAITKKVNVNKALQINPSLGLPPYPSSKNKIINLHVYETHERDKDPKLLVYKNQIGLRDNDILKAVWEKWALESGFKSFTWKKY
jgi:hypothetical protein